jgi:single-strand DNA-binding protein
MSHRERQVTMTTGRSEESVVAAEVPVNEVRLVGRVAKDPEERDLPSGDRVVTLRLVVPRSAPRRSVKAPTVDAIDVACWTGVARRAALRLKENDHAIVQGALRRRFFRTGVAVQSRYEVEATMVRRVTPARTGASTRRPASSGDSSVATAGDSGVATAGKGTIALGRAP